MVRFLSPGFAWMLAAPAAIVVLYLLRRRFQPRQVPSVFLWRRSLRDNAANRPFQRLVRNLLLPLQLLAALALALALMNPVLPGGQAGHSILIFDVSGSMQAVSQGRTRMDLAKEAGLKRIREMPAEETFAVIAAGDQARRILLSGNREAAEKAVGSLTAEKGGADFERALELANALARDTDRENTAVTAFSDALRLSELKTNRRPAALMILNVGEPAENRAVSSLTAEPGKAYVRVANFGQETTVTLTCEADGAVCGAEELRIPAGESAGVSFDIPEGTERVRVRLREPDALAADNAAEARVRREKELRVAVTGDSVFLESALKARPNLTVIRAQESALPQADVYALECGPLILTTRLPEAGYNREDTAFGEIRWEAEPVTGDSPVPELEEDPLTAGLTMKNVFFRSWRPLSGGRSAMMLNGETVICRTEEAVVLGFDLHDTNLPLKYDFPVLIQNALNLLLSPAEKPEAEEEALMPLKESDIRDTAPDQLSERAGAASENGYELKQVLLALFLILMVLEMGVSRYVC